MRNVMVLVVAALLVAAVLMVVAPGNAVAYQGAAQLCRNFADFGHTSVGDCVSYLQSLYNRSNADVVIMCKDPELAAAFRNQGECVRTLQGYAFP